MKIRPWVSSVPTAVNSPTRKWSRYAELAGACSPSVSFDQQPIRGHGSVHLAQPCFAGFEKIAVEGEVGAEIRESLHHLSRPAVSMEQKTPGRAMRGAEQVMEMTPGIEAVNRRGEIVPRGQVELPLKHFDLLDERRPAQAGEAGVIRPGPIEDPAIESEFADPAARKAPTRLSRSWRLSPIAWVRNVVTSAKTASWR